MNDLERTTFDLGLPVQEPPTEEPARQYFYIERAKRYVEEESKRLNRPLTAAITTFGCQMNAVHGI